MADYGNNIIKKVFPVGGYYLNIALPAGLSFSNSTGAISGSATITIVAKNYTVTAYNYGGSKTAIVNISITPSPAASLSALKISNAVLSPVFGASTITYTASVGNGVTSVTVTPTASSTSATAIIKINGTVVTSGAVSAAIPLNVGTNLISAVVTTKDGTITSIYTVTITRAPSSNAYLSFMKLTGSGTVLTPAFAFKTTSYTANAPYTTTSVTVLPTTYVTTSTMKVNGITLASGTASRPIFLNVGSNTISIVVTAQDGVTKETYTITVTRTLSNNAYLSYMKIGGGGAVLSPAFTFTDTTYTASVPNTTASVTVTPTTYVTTSTQKVNGKALASGTTSPAIPLSVGSNAIDIVVAAQDGVTTLTYTITVTRAAGADNSLYQPVSVENPITQPQLIDDGLLVHQAVSPNGDGINDFLIIENIGNYPDNKLLIMNRDGQLVFEGKNYDNSTRVFDGHSNKTGQMQLPGTYFYALDYTAKGITKHKTGFLVLKY